MRAILLLLLARAGTSATHACINVDKGADADPPGEWTCFTGDEMGMVCGGDGTAEESYCTADTGGVKVCARSEGGGPCAEGAVPPPTQLDAAAKERKAQAQAQDDAQRQDEAATGDALYEAGGGTVQEIADEEMMTRSEGDDGDDGGDRAPESEGQRSEL